MIDRPRGSRHPRLADAIYPRDYGYLEGTTAGDGEGIDVFVGTVRPATLGAVVCTADGGKRDAELKLLLGCSDEDTAAILEFLNSLDLSAILIPRPPPASGRRGAPSAAHSRPDAQGAGRRDRPTVRRLRDRRARRGRGPCR